MKTLTQARGGPQSALPDDAPQAALDEIDSQHIVCTVETLCIAEKDYNKAISADCIFFTGPQTLILLS